MKSVILSCAPTECEKIANGDMSILVRKKVPKEVPFKCYIYMTQGTYKDLGLYSEGIYQNRMKVIGDFVCDKVFLLQPYTYDGGNADFGHRKFIQTFEGISKDNEILSATCLSQDEMFDYIGIDNYGYGLHISDLNIYGKPKELSEFISPSKAKKCVDYCVNGICSNLGYEELCGAIRRCEYKKITRTPKNYIYVEEQENSNE